MLRIPISLNLKALPVSDFLFYFPPKAQWMLGYTMGDSPFILHNNNNQINSVLLEETIDI